MGTKDKVARVGKLGVINAGGFRVDVRIVDYKNSYGRDRWLVTPVQGKGKIWTEQDPGLGDQNID